MGTVMDLNCSVIDLSNSAASLQFWFKNKKIKNYSFECKSMCYACLIMIILYVMFSEIISYKKDIFLHQRTLQNSWQKWHILQMYCNCLSFKDLIPTSPSLTGWNNSFWGCLTKKIWRSSQIIIYCLLSHFFSPNYFSLTSVCLLPRIMFKCLSRILSGIGSITPNICNSSK